MTKDTGQSTATAVQVALRVRPLTERDRAQPRFANLANDDVLKLHNKTVQVVPQNKLFTFDHVFGTTSTQEEIFTTIGDNLIRKFIEGYNVTILAYGQTSSGKTYTMGTAAHGSVINPSNEGIVPRSMALLFDLLNNVDNRPISPTSSISSSTSASNKSASRLRPKSRIANRSSHIPHVNNNNTHKTKYTIKVSFIEIYNEDLHDLLNSAPPDEVPPINIREDTKGRIYWTGVKEVLVHSTDDVLYYLEQGTQNRATGATDMNEKSSRSHAIFSVSLKQEKWCASDTIPKKQTRPASSLSNRSPSRLSNHPAQEDGEWLITTSKFHFVDLAGSERLKRTAAEGDRRKEGININAGLLALGNVISALGDSSKKNAHVPYRDSKLTRLLQDSLGGSATTLMIACVSPAEYNLAETLNTLQYANRARNIKNRSEKNQVEEWMTTENIELLRSLIGKLKNELSYLKSHHKAAAAVHEDFDDSSTISSSTLSMDEIYQEQRLLIADLQRQVEELDGEAAVTRERNKMVEKELQRLRLLESVAQTKREQDDFQHLVEPVIEEYEKSVAKLESQLAMTRAALNHSDIGMEEQQSKVTQLENVVRAQEQSISDLQSRLAKIVEREQSNESYIQELEGKLMKSAQDASKDQEMLNELKTRIMKFKETDENTEQYISNLEQRLATADAERTQLLSLVEELEAKVEARERKHMETLRKFSKQTNESSNTEKLILKELDEVNAKYSDLVKERDALQLQIERIQKESQTTAKEANTAENDAGIDSHPASISPSGSKQQKPNRKSLADENETASSVAALTLVQTEARLKEETRRADHLQKTLEHLQFDHDETTKELDEVLQRYHETLEQLELLERDANKEVSIDLNVEMTQAKEKEEIQHQMDELSHKVQSLTKKIAIKDSELELANENIKRLQEELDKATHQGEIDKLGITEAQEELQKALAHEQDQVSHWKVAHRELKADMDKMALDLDEKEQLIAQLKDKLDTGDQEQLQTQLQQANGEVVSLQKRLAETLGSLTVLKIAHDGLQKKLEQSDTDEKARFETRLEEVQNTYFLERETLSEEHRMELLEMTESFESTCKDLKQEIAKLQQEVGNSNKFHENLVKEHKEQLKQLQATFENESRQFNDTISHLKQELEASKAKYDQTVAEHEAEVLELSNSFEQATHELENQISALENELEVSKGLHVATDDHDAEVEKLKQHIVSLQSDLQAMKDTQQGILDKHADHMSSLQTEHGSANQQLENEIVSLNSSLEQAKQTLSQTLIDYQQLQTQHEEELKLLKSQLRSMEVEALETANKTKEQHHNALALQLKESERHFTLQIDALRAQLEKATVAHTEEVARIKEEHLKTIQRLELESLQEVQKERSLLQQAQKELEVARGQLKAAEAKKLTVDVKNKSWPRSSSPTEGVAERIKLLETVSGSPLAVKKDDELAKKLLAKEEELVAQHEEALEQMKAQYEKDLAFQVESIEQMTKEHEEQMARELEANREQAEELKRLRSDVQRITTLEDQLKQVQEENLEYTALSGELEHEITRLTREKEDIVEQKEEVMNELKSLLGVSDDQRIVQKLKEVINERSDMSKRLATRSVDAISPDVPDSSADIEAIKRDHQAEIHDMREQHNKELDEQKRKLEQSEQARKKLEKQLEEFLAKKSSFLCF